MAKKFSPAPGVEILFERMTTVEIRLPSGRVQKIPDEAPLILVVRHSGSTSYFCRTHVGAWTPVADVNVGEIIDELESADEAKRAPKF